MQFNKRSRREILQLLACCGVPLAAATPWLTSSEKKAEKTLPFDDGFLQRIHKKQPEMVIIGNSMVFLRLDVKYLMEKVRPLTLINITIGATRSLQWFLWLKNYIAQGSPMPRLVFMPYRDYDFTDIGRHVDGPLLDTIKESMHPGDEVYLHLAQGKATDASFKTWMFDHLSMDETNKHVRKKINDAAYDVAALTGPNSDSAVKHQVDAEFGMEHLRSDVADADALANDHMDPTKAKFTADPAKNLLSKFVEVANSNRIKLVFYRVKRRPNADNITVQNENLIAYTADFKTWIESQGHYHIDETNDPRITLEMFRDGDHLHKDYWQQNSDLFLERVRHLFPTTFTEKERVDGEKKIRDAEKLSQKKRM